MKFWDSSAVVPICTREPFSDAVEEILHTDQVMVVWWTTILECRAALFRRCREGSFSPQEVERFEDILDALSSSWIEVRPADPIRERAQRLLAVHPLRTADALHLAAALTWAQENPRGLEFVCIDQRLRDAAEREGFTILPVDVYSS